MQMRLNGQINEVDLHVGNGANPTYDELINRLRPEIEAIQA